MVEPTATLLGQVAMTDSAFRPEPRQIALALSIRDVPFRFHASVYVSLSSPVLKLASALPRRARDRILDTVKRRYEPEIDERAIRSWLFPDVVRRVGRKLRCNPAVTEALIDWLFDAVVAGRVQAGTRIVIASQGGATRTFRRAQRTGSRAVLIASTPHAGAERELIAVEERRLRLARKPFSTLVLRARTERIQREYQMADLILANSDFTRRDLVAHGIQSSKIVTTPLGVDLGLFAPRHYSVNADATRLVYVGSVSPRKGLWFLADALARMNGEGASVQCDLYGTAQQDYLRLLRTHSGASVMTYHGPISHHRLADAYENADFFVFPSLSDGFGLVIYEAMACGVPVIVTDRCGAEVRHNDNGLVVPAGDSQALYRAIRRMSEDPELRARLAQAGRRAALSSTWERYRAAVSDALINLAQGAR